MAGAYWLAQRIAAGLSEHRTGITHSPRAHFVVPHLHSILNIYHEVVPVLLFAEVTCLVRRQSWGVKSGTHHDVTLSF